MAHPNRMDKRHLATMLRRLIVLCLAMLWPIAHSAPQGDLPSTSGTVAFVRVNVVPMDRERVLGNTTVLVRNGRIEAIGRSVSVPTGARIIDGLGKAYLSPGLTDLHVHSDTRGDLTNYLVNGVTRIVNMGDARPGFVARVRPRANRGEIPGPQVDAAFIVDGSPRYAHLFVETPEQARAAVGIAKTNGYRFIKVYNDLSAEAFAALVREARGQGLPVVGHGVTSVGLERQIEAGQSLVAHAEEFLYTVLHEASSDVLPSDAKVQRTAAWLRQQGTYVTADLNTYATIAAQWGRPDVLASYLEAPEARMLAPEQRVAWENSGYAKRAGPGIDDTRRFLADFIKTLNDSGVPLVMGTDAPSIPGLVPGFAVHDNLRALHDAGLTRYQSLSTATRQPGAFFRQHVPDIEPFGTVEVGSRADLVLSAGNPLEHLSHLREPQGVMVSGHWYPAEELRAMRKELVDEYARSVSR